MLKQHDKNLVNEPEKVKSSSVNIPPINDAVKAIEKEISQAANIKLPINERYR